ncbi:phosphatase PAP2 family protein [Roseomonas sp. CCTCC AB2023176]|uniref:phosphatase PAP2 family protein n=1 Tax=Roseomonas sp. CCTCC AB2023176 TaxID=3342640 RepID=UPI0035D74094
MPLDARPGQGALAVPAPRPTFGDHARRVWGWFVRHRARSLGVLAVAAGGFGFAWIAEEVAEGDTRAFDRAILLGLRNPADLSDPIGPPWLEEMARDVTALGSHVVLIGLVAGVVGYLLLSGRRRTGVFIALAIGSGALLSSVLKIGFARPRPDLVPHAVEVYTASFPSGHAMLSALVYLTLGALMMRVEPRRRTKAWLLGYAAVVTAMVGASRVYLGVHWPTDVLAGWCAGAGWALLCWLVMTALQRRGEIEPEPPPPA